MKYIFFIMFQAIEVPNQPAFSIRHLGFHDLSLSENELYSRSTGFFIIMFGSSSTMKNWILMDSPYSDTAITHTCCLSIQRPFQCQLNPHSFRSKKNNKSASNGACWCMLMTKDCATSLVAGDWNHGIRHDFPILGMECHHPNWLPSFFREGSTTKFCRAWSNHHRVTMVLDSGKTGYWRWVISGSWKIEIR